MEENNNLNEVNTDSITSPEIVLEPASVENPTGVEMPDQNVEPIVGTATPMQAEPVVETPAIEPIVEAPVIEPMMNNPQMPETPLVAEPSASVEPLKTEKPANGKKLGLIVAVIAILVLIAAIAGFWVFTGDKIIFEKNIDKLMAKFKIEELESREFKSGEISTKTSIDTSSSFLLPQMQYEVNADFSIDLDKNLMNIAFDIANSEDNLIGEIIAKEKGLFARFEDISDKILIIDSDFANDFENLELNEFTIKDYNKIITYLNRAININVHREDLTKEKVKITVGGKEYNSKKISYLIDEEEIRDITVTFLTNVKDDKELLKALSSDTAKLKKEIEDTIKEVENEELDNETKIVYSVYMNGFTALRHEVTMEEYEKAYLRYDMYKDGKNMVEKLIVKSEDGEDFLELTIKNTDKGKYDLELKVADLALVKGNVEKTDKKLNLKLDVFVEEENVALIKLSSNVISKDKSTTKLELSSELLGFELVSDITIDQSKKVANIDVSKAVELDEIDDEEYFSLMEKVAKLFGPLLDSDNQSPYLDDYDDYYDDFY